MPADMPPPIPPAVVKFAEKVCTQQEKLVPSGTWHQYRVYYVDPGYPKDGKIRYIGPSVYILYDGKTVRYASLAEEYALMDSEY